MTTATPTTIEPAALLQVDASVIVGIFIFLTILEYKSHNIVPPPERVTQEKKEKLLFPSIIVILFAASACSILLGTLPAAFIFTFMGLSLLFLRSYIGASSQKKSLIDSLPLNKNSFLLAGEDSQV